MQTTLFPSPALSTGVRIKAATSGDSSLPSPAVPHQLAPAGTFHANLGQGQLSIGILQRAFQAFLVRPFLQQPRGLSFCCQRLNGDDASTCLQLTNLTMKHQTGSLETGTRYRHRLLQFPSDPIPILPCSASFHGCRKKAKAELHETCIPDSVWITIEALQHRPGFIINHPHAIHIPKPSEHFETLSIEIVSDVIYHS